MVAAGVPLGAAPSGGLAGADAAGAEFGGPAVVLPGEAPGGGLAGADAAGAELGGPAVVLPGEAPGGGLAGAGAGAGAGAAMVVAFTPAGAADPGAAFAFFIRNSSARSLYSSTRLSICVRLIRVNGSALAMWLKAPSCA